MNKIPGSDIANAPICSPLHSYEAKKRNSKMNGFNDFDRNIIPLADISVSVLPFHCDVFD